MNSACVCVLVSVVPKIDTTSSMLRFFTVLLLVVVALCSSSVLYGDVLATKTSDSNVMQIARDSSTRSSVYDVWLQRLVSVPAGTISTELSVVGDDYEFVGKMETSRWIRWLFRWQGSFAAVGKMRDEVPESRRYLTIEKNFSKGFTRYVVLKDSETNVVRYDFPEDGDADADSVPVGGNVEKSQLGAPGGLDLISAMLLLRSCRDSIKLHDGEDAWVLHLVESVPNVSLRARSAEHHSGKATRCTYEFQYKKDVTRKADVWLAEVDGLPQIVKLQFRFPLRPHVVISRQIASS